MEKVYKINEEIKEIQKEYNLSYTHATLVYTLSTISNVPYQEVVDCLKEEKEFQKKDIFKEIDKGLQKIIRKVEIRSDFLHKTPLDDML
ncbi:MAG: hypothetical protein QW273_01585 [Candidatus Pacearchaeota archaeon]